MLFVAHWPLWSPEGVWSSVALGLLGVTALFAVPFGYAYKRGCSLLTSVAYVLVFPVGAVLVSVLFSGPLNPGTDTPGWASAYLMAFPYLGAATVSTLFGIAMHEAHARAKSQQ